MRKTCLNCGEKYEGNEEPICGRCLKQAVKQNRFGFRDILGLSMAIGFILIFVSLPLLALVLWLI